MCHRIVFVLPFLLLAPLPSAPQMTDTGTSPLLNAMAALAQPKRFSAARVTASKTRQAKPGENADIALYLQHRLPGLRRAHPGTDQGRDTTVGIRPPSYA